MDKILRKIYRFFFPVNKVEKPFYTKDAFLDKNYKIGVGTYGIPRVLDWEEDTILEIGNYCSIARNVTVLIGGEHNYKAISTYPFYSLSKDKKLIGKDRRSKGSVVIGHDVWIGANATILSGVTIGNGAIIGAGSVVTKDIPEFSIYAGNPAKFIKMRFDEKTIQAINELSWWDWGEEKIINNREYLMNPLDHFK